MEKRNLRISYGKAGNGESARLVLPIPWLRKLDITKESREITLTLDEMSKSLTITKRE